MLDPLSLILIVIAIGAAETLGVVAAMIAVYYSRTPQGAIAWGVGLVAFPLVALPLWLVFGRSRFNGVVNARRNHDSRLREVAESLTPHIKPFVVNMGDGNLNARVLEELGDLPFLRGNRVRLLINGEATFEAMFAAIDRANRVVVAEFFIVSNDELGREFQAALLRAAERGCDVYLLYDEVGSQHISHHYISQLKAGGVRVSGMKTNKGLLNRFQLNFRNHRKIVVIDGQCALVGGHNVANEYVGKHSRLSPWRDTHIEIHGPAVLALQLAFVEDWLWANGNIPPLPWSPTPADDDKTLFVLPSGPDDKYETCGLFFTHMIHAATDRAVDRQSLLCSGPSGGHCVATRGTPRSGCANSDSRPARQMARQARSHVLCAGNRGSRCGNLRIQLRLSPPESRNHGQRHRLGGHCQSRQPLHSAQLRSLRGVCRLRLQHTCAGDAEGRLRQLDPT